MCSFDSGCQTIWCLCFIIIWLWKCSPLFRFINKPAALLVLSLFFPLRSISSVYQRPFQAVRNRLVFIWRIHTPCFVTWPPCYLPTLRYRSELVMNIDFSSSSQKQCTAARLHRDVDTQHTQTLAPRPTSQYCNYAVHFASPPTLWRLHLLTGSWWISSPDSESEFQPACSCRRPALLDEGAAGENGIRCLSSAMLGWWMGVTSTLCMYMKTGFISQVAACCPPYLPNSALATCASFLPDNFSFYVADTPFPPRLLSAALLHLP